MRGYNKQIYATFCGNESSKQEMRANQMYLVTKYGEVANELLSWSDYNDAEVLADKFAHMCGALTVDNQDAEIGSQPLLQTLGVYIAVHGGIGSSVIDVEVVGRAIALLSVNAGYQPRKICLDSCHSADVPKTGRLPEDPSGPEYSMAVKLGNALFQKLQSLKAEDRLVGCLLAGYRDVVVKYQQDSPELNGLGMVFPDASPGVHTYFKNGGPKGAIKYSRLRPDPIVVTDAYRQGYAPQFGQKLLAREKNKTYLSTADNTNSQLKSYIMALNRYLQTKKAWKFTGSEWTPVHLNEYSSADIFKFLQINGNEVTGILNPGPITKSRK